MKGKILSKVLFWFFSSMLMFSSLVLGQGFEEVISTLKEIGVFQFYLPFILVFAIIYGLLLRAGIFGQQKGLNIIIALAISGFVMVFTPVGITFSQFLTNLAGNIVVVILTLIAIVIFATIVSTGGWFNVGDTFKKGTGMWIVILALLLVGFGVFIASGGTAIFPGIKISPQQAFTQIGGISTTTLALIILIVGTGLIVWALTRGGGGGS